ncbi:MAG: PD-(D/E)XK nuclease family protein [Ferruginibacter sp.]
MASFFHRLYKYKQSDQRHQKENFLTEILAHCLMTDKIFQGRFLSLINYTDEVKSFECQTQTTEEEFGKPDVFININDNTSVVIECKVDTTQQATQLKRYSDILLNYSSKNKHLIFLTKYFEETETFPSSISFSHIRWHQIFDILSESSNEIAKELYNYLIEERMSTKISFNKIELNAIKNFQETLAKMSEFLVRTKDILCKHTDSKIRFLKQVENGNYGILTDFHKGKLWLGFYQYEHNNEMQISISIEDVPLENSNFKEMDETLKLLNWDFYDNDNEDKRTWFNNKDLSTFFENEKFDTNKAQGFLEMEIDKIKEWL